MSGKYNDSLREIETEWTLSDVWDAIELLDAIDDARRRARKKR